MKRILFLTNYASPYRVRFFDELGKDCDVTVLFSERIEDKKHRDTAWFVAGQGNAHFVQMEKRIASIRGRDLCADVIGWLKKPWDAIVVCGYSSPTAVLAHAYLRMKKIPYYMEVDGGLIRKDSRLKYRFKKFMVSGPTWWLSTGKESNRYLAYYGADPERTLVYPFTSLQESDLLPQIPSEEEKRALRQELGLSGERIVLSVGRFDHGKGFDVLLRSAALLEKGTEVYIVGGEPTEELLQIQRELALTNVHYVGFRKKEELFRYYMAADLFALPTRSDVWGLVINESMACGLPVVSTDRCVAAVELVENGINGYVVPIDDPAAMAEKMNAVLAGDCRSMGSASLEKIRPYTIENMARVHRDIFERSIM